MTLYITPKVFTFPIATATTNALALSPNELDDGFVTITAVRTSGAWTAATLGVQYSLDNSNWYSVMNSDATYAGGTLGATDALIFSIPVFPYIRLWSHNGSGTDVTQSAAETVSVHFSMGQLVSNPVLALTNLFTGSIVHNTELAAANGAIGLTSGIIHFTKATAAVMTLADPASGTDDGKILIMNSATAAAHTVTNAGSGFNGGGAASDVGTFGGAIGDGFSVYAYGGEWWVINNINVTLA